MFHREDLKIQLGHVEVGAFLGLPDNAKGIVLFAHGSGSSRHSPRNKYVADVLHESGLATLLIDLLSPAESADRSNVFDIGMLADRLILATNKLEDDDRLAKLPVGYFGASTGAAAAVRAAACMSAKIHAVVSRGGRPDLAGDFLSRVRAPTRLIVGGHDYEVIRLNHKAFERLNSTKDITIVSRATHLFEEPGALEEVADLAREWFLTYLPRPLRAINFEAPQPNPM